ncbi:YkgJ family cysteine cluster protein [Lutimonas zeaxanthinifaciens]|uniref:YkgJ family cysteine cluster protein n=1 Tax=Lutimonas zeaxanthinifaciens TaxID=3060215 RepID=UPI00265D03A2|nr:YkgJ family cysteine cluster protein [Lutimonas sp. YSD2104]WKK67582.1 YkgJ family cysteine cluster protein [Lutimonas sp. YSD2104]
MDKIIRDLPARALEKSVENKKYFKKLKSKQRKRLDLLMQEIHEAEFENTDCLSCANCCKTTSPIFTEKDISRISKFLKMKERNFISQYLRRDEDDFMVLQSSPCTFLDQDNSCFIYEVRPRACSEYPHTNRKKFAQLTDLTLKNTEICPAVYNIVETLKEKLPL